ncbi:MAG TPA: D-amino acid dehydrogenase [Dongiaceae bacterium]|nr:D-amino acid dehydrogenase [Dongiaceae bacterium]
MRVVVLGSGVVGVTTAYYLAADGHETVVIDRQPKAGLETSYANAGLIAPGHVYSWASPRAPKILLQSLWRSDAALKFRLKADPRLWLWSLRFLANCTAARNRANTLRKLSLCLYSQAQLAALARDTAVEYHAIRKGLLYLYRDPAHFETGTANMRLLQEHGLELQAIDPARIVALEPALAAAQGKFVGAIYAPSDESGDCLKFTQGLAAVAAGRGVDFKHEHEVRRIEQQGGRITGIVTDKGRVEGDAYVLALGSYSPILARPLGLDLPVYPVKGYSLTLPLAEGAGTAPLIGGVDEANLVAYAALGDRLRLTATADFAGYDTSYAASHFAGMLRVARELFPQAAAYDKPDYWACLRPMTPDGPPIIGRCKIANLYLNTGQGHMGWTMAAGCSRIVADLIAGRAPAIDIAGLTLDRY